MPEEEPWALSIAPPALADFTKGSMSRNGNSGLVEVDAFLVLGLGRPSGRPPPINRGREWPGDPAKRALKMLQYFACSSSFLRPFLIQINTINYN